jgi:hypothetical protein
VEVRILAWFWQGSLFLLSSEVRENMKAEYNDSLVFLDATAVVLEGALGIHLECCQFQGLFSISVIVLISLSHMVLFFWRFVV